MVLISIVFCNSDSYGLSRDYLNMYDSILLIILRTPIITAIVVVFTLLKFLYVDPDVWKLKVCQFFFLLFFFTRMSFIKREGHISKIALKSFENIISGLLVCILWSNMYGKLPGHYYIFFTFEHWCWFLFIHVFFSVRIML